MTEVEKLSQNSDGLDDLDHPLNLRKAVGQQLKSLRLAGLSHLPKGTGKYAFDVLESNHDKTTESTTPVVPTATTANPSQNPIQKAPPSVSPTASSAVANKTKPTGSAEFADSYGPSLGLTERQSELNVLQEQVADCTKCAELSRHRTQTVFGVGNPAARLVFVGEGPGAQEDRQGEPFVGDAGQLLDKIISACNLSRTDVYILNTVKCRPPSNRNPSQDELANCWGYAERQLEIIQPEFICCLGSVASRTLLKTTQSLGRLRRQFHTYRGSRVLVTYHPAYLLRTPSAKRHVWEDMKLLMKEMGVDLSK